MGFFDGVNQQQHRALQRRVERLEAVVLELGRRAELDVAPLLDEAAAVSDRVRQLAASGRPIEAIKAVRQETGLGLAEAKAVVDRL